MSIGKSSLVIIAGNFTAELPGRQRRAAGAFKPGGTVEWPPALLARADEAIDDARPCTRACRLANN
jgi:hypothetical protein